MKPGGPLELEGAVEADSVARRLSRLLVRIQVQRKVVIMGAVFRTEGTVQVRLTGQD